jgi:membrane protein implicated in regulation of membrane protease activity
MPEGKKMALPDVFLTIWIIIRVGLILAVWIALFLALFLGYFTVPIIMVAVLAAIYAVSDAAFLVANQLRKQALTKRDEMLRKQASPDDHDPKTHVL